MRARAQPPVRDVLHGVIQEAEYGGKLTPRLKLIRDTNPDSDP